MIEIYYGVCSVYEQASFKHWRGIANPYAKEHPIKATQWIMSHGNLTNQDGRGISLQQQNKIHIFVNFY